MTTSRVIALLAAAVSLSATATANAADLYGGSVKDGYYADTAGGSMKDSFAAPMAPRGPSWYVRIDGGYSGFDTPDMTEDGIWSLTDAEIDGTWSIGGGIGKNFTDTLRGDITYDHRFETDARGTINDPLNSLPGIRHFGIESDVVLANIYYDFARHSRINPYVGIGLGFTHNKATEGYVETCGCGTGIIEKGSDTHVAGALMAGLSAKLRGGNGGGHHRDFGGSIKDAIAVTADRNLYLDIGYRYMYLGEVATGAVRDTTNFVPVSRDPLVESMHSHEIRFGLRYELF
jgi:opacity protein-like surface antigen